MRLILIIILFFVAGCASDDKKTLIDETTIEANIDETTIEANIDGKELFKMCASCHRPDKDFTGPALKGALKRWSGNKKAMYAFIRNSSELITKNVHARELYKKWKAGMTAFPMLSDAEIDAILNYCENYKATN